MPGIQDFTICNLGKETVRGTPVAPTRKLYVDGTGVLDPDFHLNFHEGENYGRRSNFRRATSMAEDVSLSTRWASGVSFDDLVIPFSFLNGTAVGTGAGADKTWAQTPSMTAANNPPGYSLDVGDDVQNWRVQYGMMSRFKLAASLIDLTTLEADWFGQRAVKTAAAAPANNSGVKIPGDLWTVKFAATLAGLPGAPVQTNFLIGWEWEVFPGLLWRHYMDGNPYGAQHVESSIKANLKMTVESTALAVSEMYDKMVTQTVDYVRLRAQGPVLGGSNYAAQFDFPVIWAKVPPISKADTQINLYEVTANLVDDLTNPIITPSIVNSLATLP